MYPRITTSDALGEDHKTIGVGDAMVRFRTIRHFFKYLVLGVCAVLALLTIRAIYAGVYSRLIFGHLKPRREIVIAGKTLDELQGEMHFYFGNLHSHTGYSDGIGSPAQILFCARRLMRCDFCAITDHAALLSESEWEETARLTTNATEEGRFVALRGFEAGVVEPHINVFGTETLTRLVPKQDMAAFVRWVAAHHGLAQYNHPKSQQLTQVMAAARGVEQFGVIETGNKGNGNVGNSYLPEYQHALDLGALVAPADNHDVHSPWQQVLNSHRTVIVARGLTPSALLEALRARRVYSSDDPNQKVVFKLGDAWMGSVVSLTAPAPVTLSIYVEDDEPIVSIEVVSRAGQVVARKEVGARQVAWEPTLPVTDDTFFYLRITERDVLFDEIVHLHQVTVTAPIWLALGPRAVPGG